jgi:hypothetical protein
MSVEIEIEIKKKRKSEKGIGKRVVGKEREMEEVR